MAKCQVHCYCKHSNEHLVSISTCCRCGDRMESLGGTIRWELPTTVTFPHWAPAPTAAPLTFPPGNYCSYHKIGGNGENC